VGNLTKADLSAAELSGARIMGANLANCILRRTKLAAARVVRSNLKESDLTAADLTNSSLMRVDVTGADFTNVILTGARAGRVDWSAAKVPPTELPESLPTPPPWLPVLLAGIIFVILVAILKRKSILRSAAERPHIHA
jgi:hypothetical protein